MNKLIEKLKTLVDITQVKAQRDDLYFITTRSEQLTMLLAHLKEVEKFTHMAFFQAVDYIEDEKFMLTYMLYNYERKVNLAVNVFIARKNPTMDSIDYLWPHAWQYQREIKEMYGIDFPNSPRVDESFVLEGWEEIPPMRRDFDTLEYSERTFYPRPGRSTNAPQDYMKEQKYPNYDNAPKIRRDNDK